MGNRSNRNGWKVIAGLVLVFVGIWLLLEEFFAPLLAPIAWLLSKLAMIGWPLVLIGLGILLILRARGGGWNPAGRRLVRPRTERWIGGVLGGFAQFLNVDPTLLRVLFALLTLMTGVWSGVLLYIIAMIVIPEESDSTPVWPSDGWSASNTSATPPPAAPPVPGWPTGSAPAPPPAPPTPPAPSEAPAPPAAPAPASGPAETSEQPREAPQVPPAPTVL